MATEGNNVSINFDDLLLVEKPDSPLNTSLLLQTLEDCEGHLQKLPLQSPNADAKIPSSITDMVNILTHSDADAGFERAKADDGAERKEGQPDAVFDYGGPLMKAELEKANSRASHAKAPGVLGRVVNPGYVSFYTVNGKTFAVPEGRWWLLKSPIKARWLVHNVPLDRDLISPGQVHIVRVLPGEVGMIRAQGTEVLLDVGTHVFNSGTVSIVGKAAYCDKHYIRHGRYHYLRVDRGYFAKVWAVVLFDGVEAVVPRLIGQGVHLMNNHMFKFEGFVKCSEKVIEHGSIHRISVVKGLLAKCIQDSKNRILGEGDHMIESTDFEFVGFEDITKTSCIQHGTITILRVTKGKIALAWNNSNPMFISKPGLYEFDSPDFTFDSFRDAEENLIQLGSKKIVQVQTGQGMFIFVLFLLVSPGSLHHCMIPDHLATPTATTSCRDI